MSYLFESQIAFDPTTGALARNAEGQVYAVADTSYATPLVVTDAAGVALTDLTASDLAFIPPFRHETERVVVWKSGPYVVVLASIEGFLEQVDAAAAAAELSAAAAGAAAAAAEAASTPAASAVTFSPTGLVTATDVQGAIEQAALLGGGGGASAESVTVVYTSTGWPDPLPDKTAAQWYLFQSWRIPADDPSLTEAALIAAPIPPMSDGDAWDPHPQSSVYDTLVA